MIVSVSSPSVKASVHVLTAIEKVTFGCGKGPLISFFTPSWQCELHEAADFLIVFSGILLPLPWRL